MSSAPYFEDPEAKMEHPPKAIEAEATLTKQTERSLRNVVWLNHVDTIKRYFKTKRGLPRLLRLYGVSNFSVKDSRVYAFGREVVTTQKRREEIMDENMDRFGGGRKLHSRLRTLYFGLSRADIVGRMAKEERRQLKAERVVPAKQRTFIVAARPGYFQMDLTFYHGAKIPVFGLVDVFSRWCYYEVIKKKTPGVVLVALQNAFAAFKTRAPHHKIFKMDADSGSEFKGVVKTFLEGYNEGGERIDKGKHAGELKHKLIYKQVAQPQRLIESLNGTLRQHVERVDWGRKAELKKIIREFCLDYNESIHSSTGERPNDLLTLNDKKELQREQRRQMQQGRSRIGKGRLKKLEVGALVRMYKFPTSKKAIGHRGTAPHWTKTIYVVTRVIKSTRGQNRYRLKREDGTPVDGMYFRDRLLGIVKPTIKAAKPKYDGGDYEEAEEENLDPDKPPKISWYAGAEDIRADSGSEADEDEKKQVASMDIKPKKPPARKKKPIAVARLVAPKPKRVAPKPKRVAPKARVASPFVPGEIITVLENGKPYTDENPIVLAVAAKGVPIVLFESEGVVEGYTPDNIHGTTGRNVSAAKLQKLLATHAADVETQLDIFAS